MISTLYIYILYIYIYICMYNISHVWLYDNQFFVYPSHRHRLLRIIHQGVQGGAQRGTLLDQPTPFAARFFSPKTWKKTWSLKKNAWKSNKNPIQPKMEIQRVCRLQWGWLFFVWHRNPPLSLLKRVELSFHCVGSMLWSHYYSKFLPMPICWFNTPLRI